MVETGTSLYVQPRRQTKLVDTFCGDVQLLWFGKRNGPFYAHTTYNTKITSLATTATHGSPFSPWWWKEQTHNWELREQVHFLRTQNLAGHILRVNHVLNSNCVLAYLFHRCLERGGNLGFSWMLIVWIPTVKNVTKVWCEFFHRESYQRVFNESRSFTWIT